MIKMPDRINFTKDFLFNEILGNKHREYYNLHVEFGPIEKYNFYHFYPTSKAAYVIPSGCNLVCTFCNKYDVVFKPIHRKDVETTTRNIVEQLEKHKFGVLVFHCNSSMHIDLIKKLRAIYPDKKFAALFNGLIDEASADTFFGAIDALNFIFLGFSRETYSKVTINPFAFEKALKLLRSAIDRNHVELSFYVIPYTTTLEEFEIFLKEISKINKDIPIHIRRFRPNFLELGKKPTRTQLLMLFYKVAKKYLNYVYAEVWGQEPNNTYCPNNHLVIKRLGWKTERIFLINKKRCKYCGAELPIVT